ncbi:MAG: ERCC4 domain-containing protein [Eubacteriales bacterium]
MDIQIDSREKARAIQKIVATFEDKNVNYFVSKLLVGDYMNLDNPRIIIDRKQNLQELCGNVCQQHERFKKELIRANQAGIQLIFLVEHSVSIKSIEDVQEWKNPRKHKTIWKTIDGRKVPTTVSAKAVDGEQLYKSLCTIRDRYGARFEFCQKKDTGRRIIELLRTDNDQRRD